MSGNSFGDQDEVHEALSSAVNDYGKRVLSDPRMLGSLVNDLLPDSPRERSLLITGAESGIAEELTQRVEGQRLDPNTAVNLVAESLMRSRGLDQASSNWVANEYAQALGYQVGRSETQPIIVPPPFPPAPTPPPPPGGQTPPPGPTYVQQTPSPMPPPPTYVSPPQNQPFQNFPPTQIQSPPNFPPPNFGPPSFPPPGPPPSNQPKPRLALYGGAGAAAILVLYLIVAATAHTFPFSKSNPSPSGVKPVVTPVTTAPTVPVTTKPAPTPTTPTPTPTTSSPAPTPPPAPNPNPKKLKVLLPVDVVDASTQCAPGTGIQFTDPGLVSSLYCEPNDLSTGNGVILGYQFDNAQDYNTSWDNFNSQTAKFGVASSSDCPPPSGDTKGGPTEWHGKNFSSLSGQVLECYTGKYGPVYAWTYPTENAFIVAVAPKGWTFTQLGDWWSRYSV